MAIETTSPVVAAQGSTGIMALMAATYGTNATAVGLVIFAALIGCFIALSAVPNDPAESWFAAFFRSVKFIIIGVGVSLISAWFLTDFISSYLPSFNGPYTPTFIALGVGFMCDKYPMIFNLVFTLGYQKFVSLFSASKEK